MNAEDPLERGGVLPPPDLTELELHYSDSYGAEVQARLAALGDDPGQVAQTLFDGGWTGDLQCVYHCPVSNYLTDHVGIWSERQGHRLTAITVGPTQIQLEVMIDGALALMPVPLTAAARQFTALFDDGDYPNLSHPIAQCPIEHTLP